MSHSPGSRPSQREIIPNNPVEALFLEQSKVYGQSENVFIEELKMDSAMAEMGFFDARELRWPTKEVKVQRKVTFTIPGEQDMREEITELTRRVPMTEEEATHYYREQYRRLGGVVEVEGAVEVVVDPPPAPETPKSKKTKSDKKSK